jgi:hypothetical protein
MDSLTKGSGIAVSALIAATATVLLLLPGHPRAAPGVMMATAAATSSSGTPEPSLRLPATSTPAPGRPAAGARPACRATGAHDGRARAARTGQGRHSDGPAQVRAGSCPSPRAHRHQDAPGRLPVYRGIHPDLP